MSKIHFQIVPPVARSADPVFLTGNLPELGGWEPGRGLKLEWRPPFHVGSVECETGVSLEYKITRGSWETEAVDAYGHVPGNHVHDVWLDATRHHTVADWKDRQRGRLTRERIHSRVIAGWRDLMVWLPPGYSTHAQHRFPLIVLHDGSNIFDPLTSPLSGVDWAADEWVELLSREGALSESIVVGVCHPEGFSEENETLRDFDLSPELGGAAYAEFIAHDLVRHMDAHYRTLAEPSARVLGGASLGALSSLYVALHHPGVFGNFVCLSTHFADLSASPPDKCGLLRDLVAVPALPLDTRIYFEYGTRGLDARYAPYHDLLGVELRAKGWKDGEQFLIECVPCGNHDELSWRQGLGRALRFLAR